MISELKIDDFYPTPDEVIKKMISGIDLYLIKTILEPSAGKGNIIDFLNNYDEYATYRGHQYKRDLKFEIDCIEIDKNLQYILKGKEYRLVHDDFLTFNTMKHYDLIIMNPPFSEGDKHLLKALEMQQGGGRIICLLNAETLRKLNTNARKDLSRRLSELNAEITYHEETFSNAERETDVEIALIKVNIPVAECESFIFDGLRKSGETQEASEEHNWLTEADFLKSIVKQYEFEVKAGVQLINEYTAMSPYILNSADPDDKYKKPILKLGLEDDKNCDSGIRNGYIKKVRYKYWYALFHNEKFTGKLTSNLQTDLYNKISELKEYDFSLFNIYSLKIMMNQNIVKGVEDTILNLFDLFSQKYHWLDETSKNIHYFNGWRTNKAHMINKKVIIVLNGYGSYLNSQDFGYDVTRKILDIEKVFTYLDGGRTADVDALYVIRQARKNQQYHKIGFKFFDLTFYKKGTCHIEFRDMELLKKFNIFGSQKKNWLPPSYAKKKYSEMTTEEKDVINSFEGAEAYSKTMAEKDYFIFNPSPILGLPEPEPEQIEDGEDYEQLQFAV